MRLSDNGRVQALVVERAKLMVQRDDSGIDILIRGELQPCHLVEAVAPAIRLELGRRIADIDVQLRKLGIEIDTIVV